MRIGSRIWQAASRSSVAAALGLFCTASFAGTLSNVCLLDIQFRSPEGREVNRLMVGQRLLMKELRARLADLAPSAERSAFEKRMEILEARVRESDGYCVLPDRAALDYMKEVVARIEECGTRNFPSQDGRHIYGRTLTSVVVNAAGEIVESSILGTSSDPIVDAQALRVLAASAPFGPMPESILDGRFEGFKFQANFNFSRDKTARRTVEPKQRCSLSEKVD